MGSAVGAVGFWAVLGNPAASVGDGGDVLAMFVLVTALVSVSLLVDVRLLALRSVPLLVARTVATVVVRVLLLVMLPVEDPLVMFVAALAPDAAVAVAPAVE